MCSLSPDAALSTIAPCIAEAFLDAATFLLFIRQWTTFLNNSAWKCQGVHTCSHLVSQRAHSEKVTPSRNDPLIKSDIALIWITFLCPVFKETPRRKIIWAVLASARMKDEHWCLETPARAHRDFMDFDKSARPSPLALALAWIQHRQNTIVVYIVILRHELMAANV